MTERRQIAARSSVDRRQHARQRSRITNHGLLGQLDGRSADARYYRDRVQQLLADIPGTPSHDQISRVQTIANLEIKASRAERERSSQGDREAREHMRLPDRLRADHQRSLPKLPPVARPSLAEVMAEATRERRAREARERGEVVA
jgi:hypothetical protein